MSPKNDLRNSQSAAQSPTDTDASPSAVGCRQGKFAVDASGQATYRISIELPPGIASCQPHLELGYSHRQPNGLIGVGWSLSGLSTISRAGATYAVDGFKGAVSYDGNDRYAFDGQRLINVQGEYGHPGTLYYTELQSWKHILAGASASDGFTVQMKGGEVWKYGATPDSRIMAAGGADVRVWALSSITDRNGNSVEYGYTQTPLLADGSRGSADVGSYYIDQISYGAHRGIVANRFVQFTYELRPDPITDYLGGYPIITSYRLKQVSTSLAGNNHIRSYALDYRRSKTTQLSRLETITESGTDSAVAGVLPPTKMVWQDIDNPGFDIGPSSQLNQHLKQFSVQQMDVSGSGRTDIVQLWFDQKGKLNASTYLATPGSDGTTFVYAGDSMLGTFPQTLKVYAADVNGDGLTDLLLAYKGSNGNLRLAVFLSNGAGFDAAPGNPFDTGDPWFDDSKHLKFFAMDVNGDGRTDLVEAYSHHDPNAGDLLYFRTYLSQFGDGPKEMFTDAIISPTDDPATPPNVLALWAMDVNGDGMIDVVRVWKRGSDAHIIATAYVSVSTGIDAVSFAEQIKSDLGTLSLANTKAFLPVDVNGNGVQDLLQVWQEPSSQGTTLHLTTFLCDAAGGFVAGPDTAIENRTLGDFYPIGFNGGGLTALVNKWISGNNELMFTIYAASPSGSFWEQTTFDAGTAGSAIQTAKFFPGDANGDGKADLIRMSFDENQQVLIVPYVSSGAYPDLVSSITNPLGGLVAISYLPLSDSTVYSEDDELAFPNGAGRRYANRLTPTEFPVQAVLGQATYVVSNYSESNDPDLNRFAYASAYLMTYSGACLNLLGRGWEGFRTVSKLNQNNGLVTVQAYNQDFPFTGTLASTTLEANGTYATDPLVPKDQTAVLLSITSSKYEQFPRATGATGMQTQVLEVLNTASRVEYYDYGADNFDCALAQTYAYDDYGNQTEHVQLGYTDDLGGHPLDPDNPLYPGQPLDPAEVVYRYNLYQNDIFPDGWALGFLRYAKVSSNSTDTDITRFLAGDYHLDQKTYTASTYDLESESRWDDVHNRYLTISYEYDVFGNRVTETRPGGFVTRYDYDPDYNTFPMRITSPANEQGVSLVVLYGYDPRYGVEVARCDADQDIAITALDAFGRNAIRQGPLPKINGAASDPNAVTTLVTGTSDIRQAFLGAIVVTLETTNYLSDGQQGLYAETQSLQNFPVDSTRDFNWKQKYVDGLARDRETVAQSGQSEGNVVSLTDYDTDGKTVMQSLPFFSTTSIASKAPYATLYTYDVLGRALTQKVPIGPDGNDFSTITWEHQGGGVVKMTSATGSNAQYVQVFEHHFYDGKDKVRQTVVPSDDNATTSFDYDPIARLTKATDPATATSPQGVSNTITYDSLDRRLTFDNPDQNTTGDLNVKAMSFEYDANRGLLSRQTDAAGEVTAYAYDGLDRLTNKTLSDGRVFVYTYDDPTVRGQARLTEVRVQATDETTESQYDFSYDKYGNVNKTTLTVAGEPAPFVTTSIFDPQKRVIGQTLPDDSQLIREYSFGQLVSQSLDGARIDYPLEQYDALGRAWKLIYGQGVLPGAGVVTDYTYSPAGQVYEEVVTAAAGQVLDYSYEYDQLTQILKINDKGGTGNSQTFGYLNKRLQTAVVPGFGSSSYDYDTSGNLTMKEGVSYVYQAHFPLSGTASGNLVYTATPDACGRTMTRSAGGEDLTFAYDGLGNLQRVSITTTDQTIREILSDYTGRRLRQTEQDGTQVIYVGPSYQVTRPATGPASVTKFLFDDRGTVASITTGSDQQILYFRIDHKGSTTHSFGQSGTVVSQVTYSGYGQMKMLAGPDDFQRKYEHREWDEGIGLYYFGARYYDPMTGRFLTPDTQLGGESHLQADVLNRYAFELNNPVNLIDRTGNMPSWGWGVLIGVALVVVGAAIIIASGGTAAPLAAAMFSGMFIAGGLTATAYSATHKDNFSWKDFAIETGVSGGIGFITGGLLYGLGNVAVLNATVARSFVSNVVGTALISGTADVTSTFLTNALEGNKLSAGLANAAIFGTLFGAAGGALGFGFGKLAARYTIWRYGEEIEQAADQSFKNDWKIMPSKVDAEPRDVMTSFPQVQEERVPLLQAKKIEEVMNGRVARLTQFLLAGSTEFPEAYLENRQG
jgi:RHS repeat-associated protein